MKNILQIIIISLLVINPIHCHIIKLSKSNVHFGKEQNNIIHSQKTGFYNSMTEQNNYLSARAYLTDSSKVYDRGIKRIIGEVLVGAGIGFVSSIVPLAAISFEEKGKRSDYTTVAIYSAYILGSSFGVYILAKNGNKDLSFLSTLGYASLGGAIATIPLLFKSSDESGIYFLLLPLAGALLYANILAPYPSTNTFTSDYLPADKHYVTHKDFYNKSILLRLNIFQIEL